MDINTGALAILVQAGFAGTTILLIWVVWKLVTNHDNHMLDSLNRNTDAWGKNTEALSRLCEKIDQISK